MLEYFLLKKVWLNNLALFILCFDPITLKQLNTLTSIDTFSLSRWSRCSASDCGARCPVFDSLLWEGFYGVLFCFVVVVAFLFFWPKHIINHDILQLTYRQPAQNGVLTDQLCRAIYCIHLSIMSMQIAITINKSDNWSVIL